MKIHLTIFLLLTSLIPLFGQDTTSINLEVRDTVYAKIRVLARGTTYHFQNHSDTAYLDLEPQIAWTMHVYNQVECHPKYQFKSDIPDGVYRIYNESVLVEVVQFKNQRRIGKSQKFEYKVVGKDINWIKERTSRIGYHGACKVKENTFKLVVYKTVSKYQNGEVKRCRRSVYLRKKLCGFRYNREKKKTVSYLIYREFKKRISKDRKVRNVFL